LRRVTGAKTNNMKCFNALQPFTNPDIALKLTNGGIEAVFGEKVMDQWAAFISHFYYAQHECNRTCTKILENKG